MSNLMDRSKFLLEVFEKHIPKQFTVLEIGCGDDRNVNYLRLNGYNDIMGIDKNKNYSIEDFPFTRFDVIFSMSCFFLLKDEEIFKKIASMANKYIITIEGEVTKGEVIGRDYSKVFGQYGFEEVEHKDNVFNEFGHLRVLLKK